MSLRDWQRNRIFPYYRIRGRFVLPLTGTTLMDHKLKLQLLDEKFAICRMPQFAELPSVFAKGEMCFVMRTDDDLTIISPEFMAPDNGQQETGYRCIRTTEQIPLNTTGILISLVQPLTDVGIGIFAVSTFQSDYIFLMEEHLVTATQALQHAGHEFIHEE
jgi:uncharacterized protein